MIFFVLLTVALADDWPQYRGPNRDDVSVEKGLLPSWPEGGPKLLWTFDQAGVGYSGPAVAGRRLYTLGGRGDTEFLIAIDPDKGAELWAAPLGPLHAWDANQWSAGPNSTPTVDGDAVFALGAKGDLICAAASDGKIRWRVSLPNALEAEVNPIGGGPAKFGWGHSWSPLVDGTLLICTPGGPKGTVAALDKRTGRPVWRSSELTESAAYTSPVRAEIEGVRQFVILTNEGLRGIAAASGKLLWRFDRKFGTEVVNSPMIRGNQVFLTVGGNGGQLIRVKRSGDKFEAEEVYKNRNVNNHHGDVVLVDGHLYGASEGKGWVCQSLDSGELLWAERSKVPMGSVTMAEGRFYAFGERDGMTALVEATTTGCTVTGRFLLPRKSALRKPKSGYWTPPVVANGKLFLRDQELLFCYDVKAGR